MNDNELDNDGGNCIEIVLMRIEIEINTDATKVIQIVF